MYLLVTHSIRTIYHFLPILIISRRARIARPGYCDFITPLANIRVVPLETGGEIGCLIATAFRGANGTLTLIIIYFEAHKSATKISYRS